MPVFNEGPTLAEILARVLKAPLPEGWTLDVTLVDDGSAAEAAAAVREVAVKAAAGAPVQLLVHLQNRGKGAALLTAFDHVLATAGKDDAVLVQDADLEYDPTDYAPLLAALLEARKTGQPTAVFGNRWGGTSHKQTAYRRVHALANRTLTAWSNVLTGLRVHDMECCYKVMFVPLLRQIRVWLSEERFGIEPQIAAALARVGAAVVEVPVSYDPRTMQQGKKIRWNDGVHAFVVIARERARRTPPRRADEGKK